MSVKSSIRDLNTISYIHTIVFWTSDSNDLIKVPSEPIIFRPGMGGDGAGNTRRGEGGEAWGDSMRADPVFVFEPYICKIQQLNH